MTEKIAIITDSGPFLCQTYVKENNIEQLPLVIVFKNESLREITDMTHLEFYDKLRNAEVHPKTSQPSYGEQVELYQRLVDEGYTGAIAIHVSGRLSGTVVSAEMAAREVGLKTEVIDSKIGSFPMQLMVEKAVELRNQGVSLSEMASEVRSMVDKTHLYFIPSSLEQLHKSGRVSGTASLLANLLNIKLIIGFEKDGAVALKQKIRSEKKARIQILDILKETIDTSKEKRVAVIHCNNLQGANEWISTLKTDFPSLSFEPIELSACVGVHAGEGTLGLAWMND